MALQRCFPGRASRRRAQARRLARCPINKPNRSRCRVLGHSHLLSTRSGAGSGPGGRYAFLPSSAPPTGGQKTHERDSKRLPRCHRCILSHSLPIWVSHRAIPVRLFLGQRMIMRRLPFLPSVRLFSGQFALPRRTSNLLAPHAGKAFTAARLPEALNNECPSPERHYAQGGIRDAD